MILIAGGTGTLGRVIVRRLLERGERVRVMTRDEQRSRDLGEGVDVVTGDVRSAEDVNRAMSGATKVISAIHGFAGPGSPSPEAIDRDGNRVLIGAARKAGVAHFVMISVQDARPDHPMSLHRSKYAAEETLRGSDVPFTVVRATAFMETWSRVLGEDLTTKRRALVFGDGKNPINFVSVRDVAKIVVERICAPPENVVVDVAGPENLGFDAFATRLVKASGVSGARISKIPRAALRVMSVVARPFSPAFARQAHAAVVMDTTTMAVERLSSAGTTLDEVLAAQFS